MILTQNRSYIFSLLLTAMFSSMLMLMILAGMTYAQEPPVLDDQEISFAIQRELLADELVAAHLVNVSTENGVVTLSGTVDHLLAKDRAERIAESTKGVLAVKNLLIVEPAIRTDEEIREDVEVALTQDPATDSYEIDVAVDKGVVTLTGTVESVAEKTLAAKVAKGVKGVIALENNVRVAYPTERSDTEIQAEIERRLELHPQIDELFIDVTVENGEVALTGVVGSVAEQTEALQSAWTAGVQDVDMSGLSIEWWTRESMYQTQTPDIKTDAELARDVNDALLYEPRVTSFDVNVQVENGAVTLSGVVDNYKAKRAAEEAARGVAGIWRVKNYISVRPETLYSDQEVADNVRSALQRDPLIDRYEITVSVVNKKVYLYGTVDTYSEKWQAEDVAARVNGVADVQNSLQVDYEWTWKSDQAIEEDVRDEYFWSLSVDGGDILVTADNGEVILTGDVDSWSEHQAAVDNAFEAGAKAVTSYLNIQDSPWSSDSPRHYEQPFQYNW